MIHRWLFLLSLFLPAAGCLAPDAGTAAVPSNPFGISPSAPKALASRAQPSVETAARVDGIGRHILAANPQTGFGVQSPQIRTIGVPQPEIFHIGTTEIDITEGLAKQCATEGQLAAVLCMELGKMVSEREARTPPQTRAPERQLPMEVRIGNDNAGSFGPADQMHRAELAKYDDERQRQKAARLPPNPQTLAISYLKNAGYSEGELETVAPLLRGAGENATMANQLTPAAPAKSSGR